MLSAVSADASGTGQVQMPLGKNNSEPRCDMPANRKPPFP
jgi:hypothetical protein